MEKKSKKKVLKIVLIIIGVLIVLALIHTIRNFIIIKGLQNKIGEYTNSTNYYAKSVATQENGTKLTIEYYQKDNKNVTILTRENDGEVVKISNYNNGERTDTFIESKDSKIAKLDSKDTIILTQLYNYVETENNGQTLTASILAKIRKVDYNGKQCYSINDFFSSGYLVESGTNQNYLEKDTGLCVKSITGTLVTEREYQFNNVDDSIFVEPDISQYTLKNDVTE